VFEQSIVSEVSIAPNYLETNETAGFFSNSSGGTHLTANWSTGDGGGFVGGNGSHAYRAPGAYVAQLTVTDIYGVQNVTTSSATVHLFLAGLVAPSAADRGLPAIFSAFPVNGTAPYNFTWVFSDGTGSYGASVRHAFDATGGPSVLLTVRDATGTVVNQTVSLRVDPPMSVTSSVTLTVLDVDVTTNLSVAAVNGTSPYQVVWNLPDNRIYVGDQLSYRPTIAGPANLSVSVTDAVGAAWSDEFHLIVNPPLNFTVRTSSNSASLGRSVSFTTNVVGGTTPYSYAWRFGDGGTSSVSAPSHTYPRSGEFTVTAWVNDSGGGSLRQTIEVKIPKTSGGLLWEILALPTIDLVAIVAALVLVGTLLIGLVIVRRRRSAPANTVPPAVGTPKA
jgi:PKD repeat protein